MTELLTAAQMRAIEQAAIESGQVTGLELMERAGRGVVEAVFEEWPELAATSHRAVVLCGPGNNGGDGFVVARLLKEWGWEVEVFLYGDADKLPPDAKVNYERWVEMGCITPNTMLERDYIIANSDLTVDAIFGTGLARPLEGDARAFCMEMFKAGVDVAIDIPSGFCADSGRFLDSQEEVYDGPMGVGLVVTFERAKVGHYLGALADQPESIAVKTIGLSDKVPSFRRNGNVVALSDRGGHRAGSKDSTSMLRPGKAFHKYTHGHALVLSGASGKGGAARLAARGALRIGAGVVTVGCPPDAVVENASQLNAIMLEVVYDADALARVLTDTRINALCLGPALGKGAQERELVRVALEAKRPTVLDADALSILFFDEADALFGKLHKNVVLTPHAGEFARLFPDIAEKLNAPATKGPAYSKVDATREAAKRAGCVVLFKGADTVIADPDGRASINSAHYERAAPWLATAGSGDVLAGFITGLLARGYESREAAETAAWLHVECALHFGPGLIAEDLPEQLPEVFRSLGI
ncbi:NAD(P)H-hydrate dehydratase [Profundibacter sp.]